MNKSYSYVLQEVWKYFASVMLLYDRKIIGCAYGKYITAYLALDTVINTCLNVIDTIGIILHSDLVRQYSSDLFEDYMKTNEFIYSFRRK